MKTPGEKLLDAVLPIGALTIGLALVVAFFRASNNTAKPRYAKIAAPKIAAPKPVAQIRPTATPKPTATPTRAQRRRIRAERRRRAREAAAAERAERRRLAAASEVQKRAQELTEAHATEMAQNETRYDGVVSIEEYHRLETGMSYADVVGIVGMGQEQGRVEAGGSIAVSYGWINEDRSSLYVVFEDGKLFSKSQFGLR